jgi:acyl dehydratase
MALNLDAVGRKIGPFVRSYDWKDLALYAVGVGAGFDELDYCYEKRLRVIPTFGAAMTFEVVWHLAALSQLNAAGVVHGEHEMVFRHPIPPQGTLITEGAIARYYDKGREKGALVMVEFETRHAEGQTLFSTRATMFARLDGGFGGENAPRPAPQFPERAADCEVQALPTQDQPLVYRLSGDTFPLHIDPDYARAAGFERPIMHGLCTMGFACRALVSRQCPGVPENVRRIGCRFKRPLYPGTPVKTLIWVVGEGRALWRVLRAGDGGVVIDNGIFEYGESAWP